MAIQFQIVGGNTIQSSTDGGFTWITEFTYTGGTLNDVQTNQVLSIAAGADDLLDGVAFLRTILTSVDYPPGGSQRSISGSGDPQLLLSWADDGTSRWSTPLPRNVGNTGQSNSYMRWYRLGFGRNRVFKTQYRNATKGLSLYGATVEITPTKS